MCIFSLSVINIHNLSPTLRLNKQFLNLIVCLFTANCKKSLIFLENSLAKNLA